MNLPLVLRSIARRELDESIEWYETRRAGLGLEFSEEFETELNRIARNPEQFARIRGSVRRAVLQRFPYTIHFLHESDRIVVLAVFHAKRNPERLEGR
jgi:plasmid stabilization system protein ParE